MDLYRIDLTKIINYHATDSNPITLHYGQQIPLKTRTLRHHRQLSHHNP
jgi:hypothetical protein